MMLDDDVTIQDKADVLYNRVESLAVNGEITVEQFVILDEALSLWVEYRQALAKREYDEWLRREVEEESRATEEEMAEYWRQAAEEEASRDDFFDVMVAQIKEEETLALDAMEDFSYQTEYNREERV